MRTRSRLAAWLGHPIRLGLGILALAGDIATVVGWAQDDDSTIMNIDPGPPVYTFVLFVSTALTAIFLWSWYVTFPHRPRNRFKALYSDITAARDALQTYMMSRSDQVNTGLVAGSHYIELVAKLQPFDIELPGHDLSDVMERGERWQLLSELAAHASVGDIRAARAAISSR